jgi:hypothetical protein
MLMRAIATTMTLGLVFAMSAVAVADAQMPDWEGVSDLSTVEVLTEDEDGSLRETTVWILVQDGEAYVRTGDSRWGENVVRSGQIILRTGETDYPLGVEFEEDDERRATIKQGFRDKYGWFDGMISWVRGDRPKHIRLVSRS